MNKTLSSLDRRDSKEVDLSFSQKNSESVRRGLITRSLPSMITDRSLDSILATEIKAGNSLPSSSTIWKYFWCDFIAEINASSGTAKNLASKAPENARGYSTRAHTSSNNDSSITAFDLHSMATCMTCSRIISLRASKSTSILALSNSV